MSPRTKKDLSIRFEDFMRERQREKPPQQPQAFRIGENDSSRPTKKDSSFRFEELFSTPQVFRLSENDPSLPTKKNPSLQQDPTTSFGRDELLSRPRSLSCTLHQVKRRKNDPSCSIKKDPPFEYEFSTRRRHHSAETFPVSTRLNELPKTKLDRCTALTHDDLLSRLEAFRMDQKMLTASKHPPPRLDAV